MPAASPPETVGGRERELRVRERNKAGFLFYFFQFLFLRKKEGLFANFRSLITRISKFFLFYFMSQPFSAFLFLFFTFLVNAVVRAVSF